MDILDVPLWLLILTVFMASIVWYCWHMTKNLNLFERLGIFGPPPMPIVGNLGLMYWWNGSIKAQVESYQLYKDRKFYGSFDANVPVLNITDCDMVRDILVNHFNDFTDRPNRFDGDPLMDRCIDSLHGDCWRKTRETIGPAFNPDVLTVATSTMQRSAHELMNYLKPKIDWRKRVELSELSLFYTTDVHTGLALGEDFKTFENLNRKHLNYTEKLLKKSWRWRMSSVFFPFMSYILPVFGIGVVPKYALKFFNQRIGGALEKIENDENNSNSRLCFSGIVAAMNVLWSGKDKTNFREGQSKENTSQSYTDSKISRSEIEAHTFTFVHSGIDKVAHILSLTLFLLANHPRCCKRLQEEIDDYVGIQTPDEKNFRDMIYLDQCICETMRMYPPNTEIERVCTKETVIQGTHIPTNLRVKIPVYALHHDAKIWPDPDIYRPERFDPEQKTLRHPCAFLPFGLGPRNCLGTRLALLELKIAIVYIMRVVTPLPCPQTVFPIQLQKWKVVPEDDLWVRVRPRFWI